MQLPNWLRRYGPSLQTLSLTMDDDEYSPHPNHAAVSEVLVGCIHPLTNLCRLSLKAFDVDPLLKSVTSFGRLTALELPECSLDPIPYQDISQITILQHLDLHGKYAYSRRAKAQPLTKLQQLTYLNLSNTGLSNEDICYVGTLHNIKYLNISSNSMSGAQLTALAPLTQLTHLDISSNSISSAQLAALGPLTQLVQLGLASCDLALPADGPPPPSFPHLFLPNLRHLILTNPVTLAGPAWLSRLTTLTRLEAEDLPDMDLQPFLAAVAQLFQLQDLSVIRHELRTCYRGRRQTLPELTNPAAYSALASLQQLTSLLLDEQGPDGSLKAIFSPSARMPALQLLHIYPGEGGYPKCLCSQQVFLLVQCCPSLRQLTCTVEVSYRRGMKQLSCLSALTQLSRLRLGCRDFNVEEEGVVVELGSIFRPMKQLRQLGVGTEVIPYTKDRVIPDVGVAAFAQLTQVTRLGFFGFLEINASPVSMHMQRGHWHMVWLLGTYGTAGSFLCFLMAECQLLCAVASFVKALKIS